LPKIFFNSEKDYSTNEVNQIQNHILWWLSYCRKIKFPNYQASLGSTKSDFFEVLIYLFSKYTRVLLNSSIYQQYEEINRELSYIKGRLNTSGYINENLSKGKWHKLNCTYDAFVFDNEFNRIIKYVVTLLFNVTSSQENKKNLREILFILDEVSDERASDTYLDEGKAFNLKPDLWLKTNDKSLIADTKYKIVYSDEKDPKKGISQNDLYQMLAYAVRFEVDEIILFYPVTIK